MNPLFLRLTLLLVALFLSTGCGTEGEDSRFGQYDESDPAESVRIQAQVMTFCGACHNPPSPDTFPRDAWYEEIELAYRLFHESGRRDLTAPPMSDIVRWYRHQAPFELTLPSDSETPSPIRFRRESSAERGSITGPGVSSFQPLPAGPESRGASLLFCDMVRNSVSSVGWSPAGLEIQPRVEATTPAQIVVTDLDQNGVSDYLLCELGSFAPEDHDRGRLLWLRDLSSSVSSAVTLVDGVGRVVDVSPGDFDGDGDLELVVAVFGWRKTGQLLYLEQTGTVDGVPQFSRSQLDHRHGAIHVPTVDLDCDGDLDFVALFSQEHETIEAFLNRGDGSFERQIVYLAGSPSYGSSGIELVDFDRDGDVDVLYTNGDTLDSTLVKPYHSVQWLENKGDFPFVRHHIGSLPGAMRAVAADLDGDEDLDVVASAWIPVGTAPTSPRLDGRFATLVWYEQVCNRSMASHVLVSSSAGGYMTTAVSDLDLDGDLDIVVGAFDASAARQTQAIEVLWNDGSH
jgi:hypothetical protein